MIHSSKVRDAIIRMLENGDSDWIFCEFFPTSNSPKWSDDNGVLILVLGFAHFSVLGINKVNGTFHYVHLCNEGRPLPINYLERLGMMSALDVSPRHGISNFDGNLCRYYVLEFVRILMAFGTDIQQLNRNVIRTNFRVVNDEVIAEFDNILN